MVQWVNVMLTLISYTRLTFWKTKVRSTAVHVFGTVMWFVYCTFPGKRPGLIKQNCSQVLQFSLYILSFLGKTLNHRCSMSIFSICMLIHSHIAHPCCAHQYNLLLNLEILFKGIAMTISWKLLNCFDRILPNHCQHCLANSCALCANLISFFCVGIDGLTFK